MRWEDEIGNNDPSTFRTDVDMPVNICFAALRLRAKLAKTGKVLNDYRITTWGRFCRKYWIDELPMIINLLKGELKYF